MLGWKFNGLVTTATSALEDVSVVSVPSTKVLLSNLPLELPIVRAEQVLDYVVEPVIDPLDESQQPHDQAQSRSFTTSRSNET